MYRFEISRSDQQYNTVLVTEETSVKFTMSKTETADLFSGKRQKLNSVDTKKPIMCMEFTYSTTEI